MSTQESYYPEREPFLVKLNDKPLGGVAGYRLRTERKCTPTQTVGGGAGTLLCEPACYTVTLSRFLPGRITMSETLGMLLSGEFRLSIVRSNRTDVFEGCRAESVTESIDARGRMIEELVCVSQKCTHTDELTEV